MNVWNKNQGYYPYQDKHKYGVSANPSKKEEEEEKEKEKEKKPVPFSCSICKLSEVCHYYGQRPPFARGHVEFKEDTFVMMDPFTLREKGRPHFLAIGSKCGLCANSVCLGCSIFYRHRVCKDCAFVEMDKFPSEIQAKVKKL